MIYSLNKFLISKRLTQFFFKKNKEGPLNFSKNKNTYFTFKRTRIFFSQNYSRDSQLDIISLIMRKRNQSRFTPKYLNSIKRFLGKYLRRYDRPALTQD